MKKIFTILLSCLTVVAYSQTGKDLQYFYSRQINNDSTFKYFMSILNRYDSINKFNKVECHTASERVGDYYKAEKNYLKAIAYYDSVDTKYSYFNFCGNAVLMELIPRRYKVSQCYLELNDARQAIKTLTPYIFDDWISRDYFDSTMISYYYTTLSSIYSKQEIRNELKKSINSARYNSKVNSSTTNISCRIKIFDSEIEITSQAFPNSFENRNKIPPYLTKESILNRFTRLKIYKILCN